MKKLLLLSVSFILSISFAKAQKVFDMDPSKSFIVSPNNPTFDPNYLDTVKRGHWVYFDCVLQNDGTATGHDSFPGGKFAINLYYSTVKNDWPAKAIYKTFSDSFAPTAYLGFTHALDSIYVDTSFTLNEESIIIIWPNGGSINKDSTKFNNKRHTNLNVYTVADFAGVSGIKLSPSQNFSVYPNPVKDVLNVEMNIAGKGTIKLTDMEGKIVAIKPFDATKGSKVSLNLKAGNPLPEGVYLLNICTNTYSETSKILISQ